MSELSDLILGWYDKNARVLPWRGHPDPYAIWVSEIMLQQTRVETVIPYFERWMRQFPDISALAEASQQTVLSAWEGLGYYSRVRNLHKAAQMVVDEFGGQIPADMKQLRKLPGIGRYTAAAIASIAFNQDVATLDGNLRRVFARVYDVAEPADAPQGEEILWTLAQGQLPPGRAGDYNQALMDLGSAICLPKKPLCLVCPLMSICRAQPNPESRPVLKPKQAVPHRVKLAAVIILDDKVLLSLRPASGLLGGMWEFPAGEAADNSDHELVSVLDRDYSIAVTPLRFLMEVRHAYTHFTLTEFAWQCQTAGSLPQLPALQWIPIAEIGDYPMGKVDRAIADKISRLKAEAQ